MAAKTSERANDRLEKTEMMLLRFVVIAGVLVAVSATSRAAQNAQDAARSPVVLAWNVPARDVPRQWSEQKKPKPKPDTPPRPRPKPGPQTGGEDE